jgi:TPR repeat protein
MMNLGRIYETEKQVKDLHKAIIWYQKAADKNNGSANIPIKELSQRGYYAKSEKGISEINEHFIRVFKTINSSIRRQIGE